MIFRTLLTLILVQLVNFSFAQSSNSEILFTVDGEPVYVSEFSRIYNKNLDLVKDESQKDVDAYLKLFINYKLKLKEAKALALDKKPKYISELASYKNQLIKNYLVDANASEKLIREAYDRISNEVEASHILIRLPENAIPKDTLQAYTDLLELRTQIKNQGFAAVQKRVHNGKTIYAEDLGYFSGFKMTYDFENAAYSTKKGTISMPFKTEFGYHIVYVTDSRKSRGKVTVAHILVSNNRANKNVVNADVRIQEIYKKYQQGESFEALAKQFSDDQSSARNGGLLHPFSSGELVSSKFEEVAFGLQKTNDVSQPFKTNFGWHIVKLIEKNPILPFKKMRTELEQKVKRDSRSRIINESLTNKLKKQYNITDNVSAITYFTTILNNNFYKHTWVLPTNFDSTKPLVTIDKKVISYKEFGDYLVKYQRKNSSKKPLSTIVKENYKAFVDASVLKYYKENLELVNQDFANIYSEYRDGILIFDLMETQIWNPAKKDSLEMREFYAKNKANYTWSKRINATVASSPEKNMLKKAVKLMKQHKTIDEIKTALNTNTKINIIFTSGLMEANHQMLPKDFKFKTGISKIYKQNDTFSVVKADAVLPEKLKTFEEARGQVSADYQSNLEEKWLTNLNQKYKVKINNDVFETLKTQIKN